MTSRVVRSLVLALAALCCRAQVPSLGQTWSEGRSAHFRILTDGGEKETAARARNLELLQGILQVISPDLRQRKVLTKPMLPSFVYFFSKEKSFKEYSELKGIEGFFVGHPDGNYLSINGGAEDANSIACHEYLHQFLDANFPGVPLWLNEGMATFFETLRIVDKEVHLGVPPPNYLAHLFNEGLMPTEQLMAVTHTSPE
jgi:hypothetical protein